MGLPRFSGWNTISLTGGGPILDASGALVLQPGISVTIPILVGGSAELAWGGVVQGTSSLWMAMTGGGGGSLVPSFKPPWVRDASSFVNWAKNLQREYQSTGRLLSEDQLDELVATAKEYGVQVRPDPPHPGFWNMPHLNIGVNGQAHIPLPPGYIIK